VAADGANASTKDPSHTVRLHDVGCDWHRFDSLADLDEQKTIEDDKHAYQEEV
jgi:hypothetical protein